MTMHAAVVRSFDHPPRYEIYDTPETDRAGRGARRRAGRRAAPPGPHRRRRDGITPAPEPCP